MRYPYDQEIDILLLKNKCTLESDVDAENDRTASTPITLSASEDEVIIWKRPHLLTEEVTITIRTFS